MIDPLEVIATNKQVCTGTALDYGEPPNLNPVCTTEADFDSLVTEYYTLFRERLRSDIAFLKSVESSDDLVGFDSAIYLLRTAKQHDDNPKAIAFYERWAEEHQPWGRAAEALADAFARAIQQLERVTSRIRRDQGLSAAWREHASIEPESVFLAVCDDLHVRFSRSNRRRLVRNVQTRLQWVNTGQNVRAAIEDLCAQEITSQLRSLPVPYFEVLDRLELIGKQDARAALLVAYSIGAATNLSGEAFLLRVEETWKVARA